MFWECGKTISHGQNMLGAYIKAYFGLKTNIIELLRLWEYEKTSSHGQNLLGAYIKAYFGFKTTMTNASKRIQTQNLTSNIVLNRVLTLPNTRSRRELSKSSGITEIENKNRSVVTKH